jgi:hypothetical protein
MEYIFQNGMEYITKMEYNVYHIDLVQRDHKRPEGYQCKRELHVLKPFGQECEGLNFEITHTYYTMRQTHLLVTKLAD